MPPRQIGDEYPFVPKRQNQGNYSRVFLLGSYSPCSRCHVNLHSKVPHRHATIEANWGRISFMSPSDRIGGNYSRVFLLRSVFPLLPMPCKFAFKGPPSTCHRGKLGTMSPQATESGGITLVFFSLDQYSPCSRCHVNLHSKVPHRHATEANWGRISFMSPSDRIGGNYSRVFLLRSVFPLLPMPCKFAFKGPPSTCHRGKLGTISFMSPSDRIGGNYSRVFLLRSVFPLLPMPCKFAFKGPPSTCHRGKLGTNILYVPKRQNRGGELLSCFSP